MKLRLGEYLLDPLTQRLERDGEPIQLQPLQLDLLVYLVLQRERVVSRDEIFDRVWSDVVVSDGALSTAIHGLRAALREGDRPRAERWIETVRGRGYRYAGPVERLDRERRGEEAEFVGRDETLDALSGRLGATGRGTGRVVLLRGPAGAGKSRLARELARRAEGCQTLTAQCEQGAPPYWPWEQVLGRLGAELSPIEPAAPAEEGADPRERFRRTRDLLAQLERAAGARPLLLVLEDLHLADRASVALLEAIVPGLLDAPVLVLGTVRTGEGDPAAFGGLLASPHVDRHELGALGFRDVWSLVQQVTRRIPTPDEVTRVHERSGGMPLFALELAREIAEGRDGAGESGTADLALARRLERVPEQHLQALSIAALAGEHFDLGLVEEAARDSLPSTRAWVEESLDERLLVEDPELPLRFRFGHALLREALVRRVPGTLRARIQQRLGEVLEARNPAPSDEVVARLAHLFGEAVRAEKDASRALHYAMRASEISLRSDAWEDVLRHTGRALGWLEQLERTPARDEQRLAAWLQRCAALTNFSESETEALSQAEAWARIAGDGADRGLAAGLFFDDLRHGSRYEEAREHLEPVAAHPPLAPIAACSEIALDTMAGRFGPALDRARELAPEGPTSVALRRHILGRGYDPWAEALGSAAIACFATGDDAEALRLSASAIELGRDAAPYTAATQWFLAVLLHDLRDDPEALSEAAREIDPICARHRVSRFQGAGLVWTAYARSWASDGVGHRSDQAPWKIYGRIVRDRAESYRCAVPTYLYTVAARLFANDDAHDDALACFEEAFRAADRTGELFYRSEIHRRRAQWRTARGEAGAARADLEQASEIAASQGATALAERARAALLELPPSD